MIRSGLNHSLAMTEHGECLAWGKNYAGQLGTGDTTYRTNPMLLQNVGPVYHIFAFGDRSGVLTKDDKCYIWGGEEEGKGEKEKKKKAVQNHLWPMPFDIGKNVYENVWMNATHLLALTKENKMFFFPFEALEDSSKHSSEQDFSNLGKILQISSGTTHTMFLTVDGGTKKKYD